MTDFKYLDVCSGISAPTVAWKPLGWQCVAYSEIEKFPSAVLAHHYPDIPNLGDMNEFRNWPAPCTCVQGGAERRRRRDIHNGGSGTDVTGPEQRINGGAVHRDTKGAKCEKCNGTVIDLLVGGTPCQSFSVAGLREGLKDPRGNLALTYLAIAERYRPTWLVWENVPGVLSSHRGRDFGSILGAMAKLGYGFAYRVLDAQYFGVPQRRRRVFVVGYLGDWRRAAEVLFEPESLCRNPPPSREAGQKTTYDVAPCLAASGRGTERTGESRGQDCLIPSVANPLNTRQGKQQPPDFETYLPDVVGALSDGAHMGGGLNGQDAYTGRIFPVPVAFGIDEEQNATEEYFGCLKAREKSGGFQGAVAFHNRQDPDVSGDVTHPLGAKDNGMAIQEQMAVRRLTPRECERLQGFPDDYTRIAWRNKAPEDCPDGPRYKALGNSMAVPVLAWIGRRIQEVDRR